MRCPVTYRNTLSTFPAISRAHAFIISAERDSMKSSEDLSGKRDVPHHFCAFPVFNQVTILGIELEYSPTRVDLATPRSFEKDSVFAFFKDLLLCCIPVFYKRITHPDK